MPTLIQAETDAPRLSEHHFGVLARLVEERAGIHLPPPKRLMVEGRVRKRLHAVGAPSFGAYIDSLESAGEAEIVHLIDVITVNKTDFFRESAHFDFLAARVLPELAAARGPIRFWSAGCSTGEEPYTLAMVLAEAAGDGPWPFSILATDISTRVLERARTAIYPLEAFDPIPPTLRRKYLLRSKDAASPLGRIEPGLRARVEFRRLNLMDQDLPGPMDVIFCRNVAIYFTRQTQERLLARLVARLRVGGYLFVGHSETLNTMRLPVEPAMPTVYRRVP